MHRVKAVSIVLTALLLLLVASVVFAQYSPDVQIVDQDVIDGEVIVARATVNGPGWVVVYADEDGEPGGVIGYAPLMNGINANIMVDLDPEGVTDQLYAVLHEDMGFVGTFEYPGDDMPVLEDDEMIIAPFLSTGSGDTEEEEPEAPSSISGSYQESDGSSVSIDSLVAGDDGWIAIRIDDTFSPGEVLGYAAVSAGEYEDMVVELEQVLTENAMVWAVLHADDGEVGVFEFPDADEPVHYNNATVMGPFNVVVTDMVEAAADEMAEDEASEEKAETSMMAGMTETVGSFLQSFLTLDGDDATNEAAAEEAAAAEKAAAEKAAAAEEAAAAEKAAAEKAAAAEEAAAEEAAAEEAAADEDSGPMAGVTETVGSFLQSFLTLGGDDAAAEEAVAEEVAVEEETMEPMDIVDTAGAAGTFETLVQALEEAELAEALKSDGPFTLFAPTDDAFAALPDGALEELLGDSEKLTQVLLYHVVSDKLMAADIEKMGEALTLEGDMVSLSTDGDTVMVGEATVSEADIDALNGVIHVIDSVLMPPMAEEEAVVEEEEEEEPEAPSSITVSYQESDGASVTIAGLVAGTDGWVAVRADETFAPGEVLGHSAVTAGEHEDMVVDLDEPLTEDSMVWAVLHNDDGEIGTFEYPDGDEPVNYNNAIVMGPFNVSIVGDEEEAVVEEAVEEATEEPVAEEPAEEEPVTETGPAIDVAAAVQGFLGSVLNLNPAAQPDEDEAVEAASVEEEVADDDAMAEEGDDDAEGHDDDAMAEEDEEAAEGDDDAMAEEGEETAEGHDDDDAMAEEGEETAEGHDDDDAMAEEAETPMEVPEELPETGLSLSDGGATLPVVALVMMVLVAGAFVTRRRPA